MLAFGVVLKPRIARVVGGLGILVVAVAIVVFVDSSLDDGPASNVVAGQSSTTSTPTSGPLASSTTPASLSDQDAASSKLPTASNEQVDSPTVSSTVAQGSGQIFEPLRNTQSKFTRYANVPSTELDLAALTEAASRPDNGTVGDGQFRAACEYSHFSYDDPIVFPGQPGRSHLHMFYGNTEADAFTTTDSLVNSGGATCNGFELNRSAYWSPALLDGEGNIVVPDAIILYYKTKQPANVKPMPQGLQMIAGNVASQSRQSAAALVLRR